MSENLLPCGYDASKMDCIDCYAYQTDECEFTKVESKNEDIQSELNKAFKETFGFDIDAIKKAFVDK